MKIAIIDSGLPNGYSTENAYRIKLELNLKIHGIISVALLGLLGKVHFS